MDFTSQPSAPVYFDASATEDYSRRSMPFAMPVSSYFRRPSRIVKSNRNQSPKHLVRRRTTAATHGHPRHPSVDQSLRRTHASELNGNQERPLSWHPTSYEQPVDFSQCSQVNFFPPFDFSASPFNTAEINGLITPMSAALPNEPQIQELMTPLEDCSPLTYPEMPFVNNYSSKMGSYYFLEPNYQPEHQVYMSEQLPYGYQYAMPQTYQVQSPGHSQLNIDTAPPSPTLLPIQNFNNDGSTSPFVLGSPRLEKDELVGMGLYDKPQDVQSSMLFSGGATSMAALTAGIGKGLKLEESFEPPPADDDDDEENENEEEAEEAEEQEEFQDFTTSATAMTNNMPPPQVYVDDQYNFASQSFFSGSKDGQHAMSAAGGINYPDYSTSELGAFNSQSYGWI